MFKWFSVIVSAYLYDASLGQFIRAITEVIQTCLQASSDQTEWSSTVTACKAEAWMQLNSKVFGVLVQSLGVGPLDDPFLFQTKETYHKTLLHTT